ncbi:efflux RND transporter permease subunit, partial [Bradyrhizobium sp. NBAIM20]
QDSVETSKTYATYQGERSITLAIQRQPDANTVQVVDKVKALLPRYAAQMPASIQMRTLSDRSVSIRESLHDVYVTLALTVGLVVLVIFIFLRRAVATLIPTASLPISLIGALTLLFALGYSLDNISLLGITLAVGLV